MFLHQRFIPGLAIASYMIGDERTKQAAVIDPTRDVVEYIRIARDEHLRITDILETHVHADFVSGSAELKDRLGETARIHCSGHGGPSWTPPYADQIVKNGDEISLGSVRLRALYTPGHTPEHITWLLFDDGRSREVPWLMFTGDFLFVGDVGRPDLLGEQERKMLAHQLYQSVFETLPGLPDYTEIFPGHGAGSLCGKAIGSRRSSSLGYERRFNPSLAPMPEGQWIDKLLAGMPLAPPYFRRMKEMNVAGPALIGPTPPGQRRFSARELNAKLCKDCIVLDVRSKEAFSAAHIPGAINIPLGPNLPTWAGWVLPYDHPMMIVPGNASDLDEVVTHLLRVGLDRVEGHLDDGMEAWESNGYEVARLQTASVHELNANMRAGQQPFILDVRTESEWNAGHIDGAVHIHGGILGQRADELPKDRPIWVICGSGYRGSIAASFLKRHGLTDVINVLGGISAWQNGGYATIPSPACGRG